MQPNLLPKRIRQRRLVVVTVMPNPRLPFLPARRPAVPDAHRQAAQTHRVNQLKMAVFAPIPSASVRIAVSPNPNSSAKSAKQIAHPAAKTRAASTGYARPRQASYSVLRRYPRDSFRCPASALCAGACCGVFSVALALWFVGCVLAVCSVGGARRERCVGRVGGFAARALESASGTLLFRAGLDGFLAEPCGLPKYKNATRRTISHYLRFGITLGFGWFVLVIGRIYTNLMYSLDFLATGNWRFWR